MVQRVVSAGVAKIASVLYRSKILRKISDRFFGSEWKQGRGKSLLVVDPQQGRSEVRDERPEEESRSRRCGSGDYTAFAECPTLV